MCFAYRLNLMDNLIQINRVMWCQWHKLYKKKTDTNREWDKGIFIIAKTVTFDDDDVRFQFQSMLVHLCNVKMVEIVQSTFLDKLCVLVRLDLEVNFVKVCICTTNIIRINYFTHISMIAKIKMCQRVWV